MTDAERPDEPSEEERPAEAAPADDAPPEELSAESGRAAEADADEDTTASGDGDAAEQSPPEAAEAPEAGTESVTEHEPDRPQSAVPDQAPEPQPVEDREDVAAAEFTGNDPGEEAPRRPEPSERGGDRSSSENAGTGDEVIPGAHLEPDLVLEEPPATDEPDYTRYADSDPEQELEAEAAAAGDPTAEHEPTDREAPAPEPRSALDLAAEARYFATGKRKTSVARVTLRPGGGTYTVNGRPLEQFFPRATLQLAARQPLQTAGYEGRMDVVARLHGGGVSAQAGALRHGIARALAEADPALRGDLKRQGFLTRDARAKERKKAGLKKARKRPQFSKR